MCFHGLGLQHLHTQQAIFHLTDAILTLLQKLYKKDEIPLKTYIIELLGLKLRVHAPIAQK